MVATIARDLLLHPLRLLRFAAAGVWTLVLALVAIVSVSLGSWAGDHVMPRVWLRVVLAILGVRVTVLGRGRLDPARPVVYVSNHRSILDGMLLVVTTARMPRFVGKRQIARLPVIGLAWHKLGHVLIDRARPQLAYATLEEAAIRIGKRYSVYFAPEGTRSRNGRLGAFKRGAFVYAQHAGLPVVPVAVHGTAALWPPDSLALRPGRATISYGPPQHVDDPDHACQAARAWIAAELHRLETTHAEPER